MRSPPPTPSSTAIADGATRHGGELLLRGFTISEVVHFYGDICQAVTELAVAQNAPVSVDEFRILNRSLDTAIAESVTEHARLTAEHTSQGERQRIGQLAHELRNHVQTASLAFSALKGDAVAANGSTGAVLARSLTNLRALVESTLSEVRMADTDQPRERVNVKKFLADVAASARLLADHHDIRFVVEPVDSELAVDGDPQLLASAVMNLLQNAFKFTPPGGAVVLSARPEYPGDHRGRRSMRRHRGEQRDVPFLRGTARKGSVRSRPRFIDRAPGRPHPQRRDPLSEHPRGRVHVFHRTSRGREPECGTGLGPPAVYLLTEPETRGGPMKRA